MRRLGSNNEALRAFSLVEVTLALGILALALVSLLGLLLPTLDQARQVRLTHATNEMIGTLSERLAHLDLDNDPSTSAFEEIFLRVASEPALFYLYQEAGGGVVFTSEASEVTDVDQFLFAARISPSGANPATLLEVGEEGYTLTVTRPDNYPEAYLALKVDLHTLPVPPPGTPFPGGELREQNFLVGFHTAILR